MDQREKGSLTWAEKLQLNWNSGFLFKQNLAENFGQNNSIELDRVEILSLSFGLGIKSKVEALQGEKLQNIILASHEWLAAAVLPEALAPNGASLWV